jgi:hypothetical protein
MPTRPSPHTRQEWAQRWGWVLLGQQPGVVASGVSRTGSRSLPDALSVPGSDTVTTQEGGSR